LTRFLYDTAVFVYAYGADHPYAEPCREIVDRAGDGDLRGEASADLVQEVLHQRARRTGDRRRAAREAGAAAELCDLHDVRPEDVVRALELFAGTEGLGARDAVFAAVALNRGIPAILSPDRAFDDVAGLARVDPMDRGAVEGLTPR
jgi:predicted nucleic acid-binding protein